MDALELYDPEEMDLYDDEDDYDFEAMDFEDDEADEWMSWLGAGLSTAANIGDTAYRKWGSSKIKERWGKEDWRGKMADSAIKAAIGGLGSFAKGLISEDADPYEPEYESEAIDEMEMLLEDALDGEDGIDTSLSADEMVSRSFGTMRGAPQLRPIMAALSRQVRQMIMAARRNPRMRNVARLAPLALRRTSVVLMRLVAARRPVNARVAMMVFRSVLQRLMRSVQLRQLALRRARMRARRARGGYGSSGGSRGTYGRPGSTNRQRSYPYPSPRPGYGY